MKTRVRLKRDETPWLKNDEEPRDPRLCHRCNLLNFITLFDRPFTDYVYEGRTHLVEIPAHDVGPVREIRQQTDCAFCNLVWKSFLAQNNGLAPPDDFEGQSVGITIESMACGLQGPVYGYDETEGETETDDFAIRLHLGLRPGIWKPSTTETRQPRERDWRAVIHRVDETSRFPHKLCCGRRVGQTRPDLDLVRRWLQLCSSQHSKSCGSRASIASKQPAYGVRRLIDVQRGCLVSFNKWEPRGYVVLSYVWGKDPFITLNARTWTALHTAGTISTDNMEIPATIRDAIKICLDLGEAYLWVDALCIKQDATDEKLEDIAHMDSFYGDAKLTIVAASGDRAEAGLPGVGRVRSDPQHILDIDGFQLTNMLQPSQELVDRSFWNSRAWTYQERLLSIRMVVFTEQQLLFRCQEMQCCEDVVTERSLSPKRGLSANTLISRLEYDYDEMSDFQKYVQIATEFCKRNLSYESDVLNALAGICAGLNFNTFGNRFVFNIPVRLIDIAILWRPLGPLRRRDTSALRPNVPCWSWAGWVGPIEYAETINLAERTLAPAFCKPQNICQSSPGQWTNDSDRAGFTRHIVDGEIFYIDKDWPEDLLCRPKLIERKDLVPPLDLRRNDCLRLTTEVARFRITLEHVDEIVDIYPNAPRCNGNDHFACHLIIKDSGGARAGCVVIDGNTFRSLKPGDFSFVKLSQTTLAHDENDPAWDEATQSFAGELGAPSINKHFEPYRNGMEFDNKVFDSSICWCLYNVMMVEWKDGVGIRLGIGKIHIHAFDAVAAEPREVLLG